MPTAADPPHTLRSVDVRPVPAPARWRRDRRLERELRRQHPGAVEHVLEQFGPLVRGYLTDRLRDRGAVEDVMQLTMLEVWRRGPTFDPTRASLSTWVLMIARSRAIDHLRRRIPEPHDPHDLDELASAGTEDLADDVAERWRMGALIAGLPRDEARVLSLRFYDGLSQRQIAERTGMALGTVKLRMVNGLERLRQTIDREEL
jgi:RNA polymerase sigma-70 factor (ECF subfamily)